jgi:hypothetical protein
MTSLAEIRKKLQNIDSRRSGTFTGSSDNYPFWNLPNDGSCRVRFLPDANPDNTFFWVEKQMIKMPFKGVVGGEDKTVYVQVPCMEMWGESCPILTETRPWWDNDGLKDLARVYWKKRTYIFQGFVMESQFSEENAPENPIRRFSIGMQIFKLIKASLLDPDFENIPTDYVNGTDFTISKTQKGEFADYSTSKWSRKETALNQAQLSAIDEHGLKDLADYLPQKPTPEQLAVIFEMFEASVANEPYDPAKWGKFYRPGGLEFEESTSAEKTTAPVAKPKVTVEATKPAPVAVKEETSDIPWEEEVAAAEAEVVAPAASSSTGKSAQEILEMIRNRNKA